MLNVAQVAVKLGHKLGWFTKHRERLEREHGFPPSVDGCGKRWDPVAIDAWLDAQMPEHLRRAQRTGDDGEDLSAIEARLAARGQAIADELAANAARRRRRRKEKPRSDT